MCMLWMLKVTMLSKVAKIRFNRLCHKTDILSNGPERVKKKKTS